MVKKGQLYIIEATLAGVALVVLISAIIIFTSTEDSSYEEQIKNNYCEDTLQVLIKRDLLKNETKAVDELSKLIPNNMIYCLRIDKQVITDYGCSRLKDDILSCKSIYTYLDNGVYRAKEVQLLLS